MGFLLGIGAAQKAAAKSTDGSIARRYPVISIVVVILLALLIVGLLVLVVNHQAV
jgi:hypothetical protein